MAHDRAVIEYKGRDAPINFPLDEVLQDIQDRPTQPKKVVTSVLPKSVAEKTTTTARQPKQRTNKYVGVAIHRQSNGFQCHIWGSDNEKICIGIGFEKVKDSSLDSRLYMYTSNLIIHHDLDSPVWILLLLLS